MLSMFKANKSIFWALLGSVTVCLCFLLFIYPICDDDFWALADIKRLGSVAETLKYRFQIDNSRLSNIFSIPMIVAPKWISGLINSLAMIVGLILMIKVAGIKYSQWRLLSLMLFLFWVAPMWENGMFSHIFAYNYIIPIPLLFGAIYIFLSDKYFSAFGLIILGLILGAWHEGFSLLFICGAILNFIFNRWTFRRNGIILTIATIIGFSWFLMTPAMQHRAGPMHFYLVGLKVTLYSWIFYIYLILWIICYLWVDKKTAKAPIHFFTFPSVILLYVAAATFNARANMSGMIISVVAITVIIHRFAKSWPSGLKTAASVLMALFTVSSLTATCVETAKIRVMADEFTRIFKNAVPGQKYAFAKVHFPWDYPAITLRRPDTGIFFPDNTNYVFLSMFTGNNLLIVPEELKNFRPENAIPIPSNSDIYLYKGHFVSTNLADTAFRHSIVDFGIKKDWSDNHSVVFETEAEDEYVYIFAKRHNICNFLGDPKSIKLLE